MPKKWEINKNIFYLCEFKLSVFYSWRHNVTNGFYGVSSTRPIIASGRSMELKILDFNAIISNLIPKRVYLFRSRMRIQ